MTKQQEGKLKTDAMWVQHTYIHVYVYMYACGSSMQEHEHSHGSIAQQQMDEYKAAATQQTYDQDSELKADAYIYACGSMKQEHEHKEAYATSVSGEHMQPARRQISAVWKHKHSGSQDM